MGTKLKTLGMMYAMMGAFSSRVNLDGAIPIQSNARTSTKEEINKSKGLKEFKIGGKSYWAVNYKNAIRKFNKDQK